MTTWPLQPRLPDEEVLDVQRQAPKLAKGRYRWYVYPGIGKRTANKYGPLIGQSDFFVTKR